jgi:hypothetical protein
MIWAKFVYQTIFCPSSSYGAMSSDHGITDPVGDSIVTQATGARKTRPNITRRPT